METARVSKQNIEAIYRQYLSDPRIKALYDRIAYNYSIAMPQMRIFQGEIKISYSEEVENCIKEIKGLITGIIEADYPELAITGFISPSTPTAP